MKKRGKLQFFIFRKIFAPLEAKMMKNDKKKMKKMKKNEKMKNKWKKNDKMMKKNEKMKKTRKIVIFHFLGNCNVPRVFFSFSFFIIFASSGGIDEK